MKRNRGIAAITGKNVIGLKSHNVINRKLILWAKNYIIFEPITRILIQSMDRLVGSICIQNCRRKSALKSVKSAVHVAGGRHEQLFRDDALVQM